MAQTSRREIIAGSLAMAAAAAQEPAGVSRYVRFQKGTAISYGLVAGDTVEPLRGDLFGTYRKAGPAIKLKDVKLLAPCTPSKVLAVGLNYQSHLGERKPSSHPEIFYKPITCLQHPGDPIVIPEGAQNVHYEGELVLVMGKRASHVTTAEARDAIFGVTCGNDVSERDWQGGPNKDLQWWRAKGADTFGPLGPMIVRGVDYGNVLLQTRVNGEVMQKQSTADLIFDCPTIVSFISKYVVLEPGDVIYTGTPAHTSRMKPGDVCEVEIEKVGTLRNPVVAT